MDKNQLNTALKQKKILGDDKLKILEKDLSQQKAPVAWEDFLVEKKVLSEKDLLNLKAEILGAPIVDLTTQQIPQDVLNLVPEPIAHRHQVISFAKTKDELSLAMTDPEDIQTKEFIQKKTGLKIKTFLIGRTSLDFGLSKYHSSLEKEIKHLFTPGGQSISDTAKAEGESAGRRLKKNGGGNSGHPRGGHPFGIRRV